MQAVAHSTYAIVATLGLLAAGATQAATGAAAGASSQADMNTQASRRYAQADASLNKVYAELMQKLPAGRRPGLRDVQKAWLRYRDLDCGFAAEAYAGGSMQPMVKAGCLAAVTDVRTRRLQDLLDEASR